MTVLITGAGGQVGHALQEAFAGERVLALTHADLDVTDEQAVARTIAEHRPRLVVHAAAYTKVDACEDEVDTAWQVNAAGTWAVARACAASDAAMVYLSTDYVFDGRAARPYTEFDAVNPQSVYGRTKEAGEQLVRRSLAGHWIVRTSWVQGVQGANFVKTMLRLGRERDQLTVVADQRGTPTFASDLAPAIKALVERGRPGTYHLTNSGSCTWYEFAHAVFEVARLQVTVSPTDTASYGAPAPRPAFSVLENRMAAMQGLPPLPHWRDALERLVAQLTVAEDSARA